MRFAIYKEKLKKAGASFRSNFLDVWPVILFFIALFSLMVSLFGLRYAMLVSAFTTTFKIRRNQDRTPASSLRLVLNSFLLCFLAYFASLHLAACILINFIVPFLLILIHSSQFSPKGYFAYTMLFVFLELRPPDAAHLPQELAALSLGLAAVIIAIPLYRHFLTRSKDRRDEIRQGLLELAELLTKIAERDFDPKDAARMERLEQKFQSYSYQSHRFFSRSSRHRQVYDMLAILFQRAAYLMTDTSWHRELDGAHMQSLRRLSAFLEKAASGYQLSGDNSALIAKAQSMLDHMDLPSGRLRIFSRSFLHMLILLMRTLEQEPQDAPRMSLPRFAPTSVRDLFANAKEHIRCRFRLEAFEFRFALRCALVITVSYTICMLLPLPRAYWLPVNAFILIQPSFEESVHRMKTRPIGTLIGCLLEALIGPLLPGTAARFLFALFMLSLMYCATPGSWNHPIFSTCYALTLTSMSMGTSSAISLTTAIGLRLFYIAFAVVLVFLANRLVFPTPADRQLDINVRRLHRLLGSYWGIIRSNANSRDSLSLSGEILSYFGMLYHRSMDILRSLPDEAQQRKLEPLLLNLWQLMSELEQIAFLANANTLDARDRMILSLFAGSEQRRIADLASHAAKGVLSDASGTKTDSTIPSFSSRDLEYVVEQYCHNIPF